MIGRLRAVSRARVRARTRASTAAAVLAAAALAGCGATGNSNGNNSVTATTAAGNTLSIYMSEPVGAAAEPTIHDVIQAEQLAYQQRSGEVTAFRLRLRLLDTRAKLSNNGRTAILDKSTVAYLGELVPGRSADTVGISNAQDLLQVSPTDTALELTQSTRAMSNTPDHYLESRSTYGLNFARVVPDTAHEATAVVKEMQTLGVKAVYVADDGSDYGRVLAFLLRKAAGTAGVSVSSSQSGADAVFYASASPSAAAQQFTRAVQAKPGLKLFAPSALWTKAFVSALGPNPPAKLYVDIPGFLPADQDRTFVAAFKAAYGHAPAVDAVFGYEAMLAVLDTIHQARHDADNRETLIKDFFAIKNRPSPLGTYSINGHGDISIAPFVFGRLKGGKLVPFKSVAVE
jgi:ABC-type branched-subunit amino acid transport system substrate-binding protein